MKGHNQMRVNVYSQELTNEFEGIHETSNTGVIYTGVRFFLHSSEKLHHPPKDDDRSAITFWLPRSPTRRELLAQTFERMAEIIRLAPPETGID